MSNCQVCDAPTNGYICKPCLGEVGRALAGWQSLMHEASVLATGGTRTYRTTERRPYSDEELAELDEEYAHRRASTPPQLRTRDGRITLPSTPRMVNLDARELLADAYDTLRGQIDDLRDLANTEPDGWVDAVPWLLRNLDVVRQHPGAGSIHDELTFMHDRMQRAVDRSPSRVYGGPCTNPECKTLDMDGQKVPRDLYTRLGKDEIVCDGHRSDGIGCGATYSYAERQDWLRESVAESLVTLTELLDALPTLFADLPRPPRSVASAWVRQGRLIAHSQNDVGEPTFVGAEVLNLVRAYRPHKYAPRKRCA